MALRRHPGWLIILCIAAGMAAVPAVLLPGGCSEEIRDGDARADGNNHAAAGKGESSNLSATSSEADAEVLHAQSAVQRELEPGERPAAIIYSGGLYGMIESCGCAGNPNGGMTKELTVVEARRRAASSIYVQPGKLFPFEPRPEKLPYILRAAERMQWDAIGLSEHELMVGADEFRRLSRERDLPFVCANMLDLQGRPIGKPYVIRELAGIRVGIFGLVGTERWLYLNKEFLDRVRIVPPAEATRQVLRELEGRVDYIIVLSQQDRYLDRQLARAFPQLNLIVSGNEPEVIKIPIRVGSTLIVNAGVDGSYTGVVNLAINPQRHVRIVGHEFLNASAMVPRHGEIAAIYERYLQETGEKPDEEKEADPLPPVYQPSSSCQPCHQAIYAQWENTAHAKAWNTLVKAGRANDPECYYCHAMGYGRKSGFESIDRTPKLANVSCQACHLVASDHDLRTTAAGGDAKPDLDYANSQRTCAHCHTPITSPNFNWWDAMEQVNHHGVKEKHNDPPADYRPRLVEPAARQQQ